MDQSVNAILRMTEQNGVSRTKKAELCNYARPDSTGETEELYENILQEFQMQDAGSAPYTPMVTPDQKLGLNKNGQQLASLSSELASSDNSLIDGSNSSSSASSDSESESFNSSGNAYYSLPVNTDHKGLYQKIVELGTDHPRMEGKLQLDSEGNGDSLFETHGKANYGELLSKIMRYEEELRPLRDSKLKLKLSEEEISRLKNELEKSQSFVILTESLQGQLESANQSIKLREADLEIERRRTMELKGVVDSANEMEGRLKSAGEEIIMLRSKLESESERCLELLNRFSVIENDLLERDDEVEALKHALVNTEENLAENTHLRSTISSFSERNSFLGARIKELELHANSLEGKFKQSEAEKMEFQLSHGTLIHGLQVEISQLRAELGEKSELVEILNNELDSIKFKYDTVEAENDGMSAKVCTMYEEINWHENRIKQMEEHLRQEEKKNAELIATSGSLQEQVHDMRMKIVELEKEVNKQRGELLAGAEEKRQAIRQLCFSLEHYRSRYKELYQAFLQHKGRLINDS